MDRGVPTRHKKMAPAKPKTTRKFYPIYPQSQNRKTISCPLCERKFATLEGLEHHKKTYHLLEEI